MYYFGFGDEKQLPPFSYILSMIVGSRSVDLTIFNAGLATVSMFERLIQAKRVTPSLLSSQFRMHRRISRLTSVPFYNCYFACPMPDNAFLTPYNQPELSAQNGEEPGFYPFTFLDTVGIPVDIRKERSSNRGDYVNAVEAEIIVQVVERLIGLGGDAVNG